MLESPVLSGICRSAAAVALASKPNGTKWANQAIPGVDNLMKAAPSDSDYRRRRARPRRQKGTGDGTQMVKFTVNELPFGSDGIDIALPFGSFMMIPFGARANFGVALLTLIALNVVEP